MSQVYTLMSTEYMSMDGSSMKICANVQIEIRREYHSAECLEKDMPMFTKGQTPLAGNGWQMADTAMSAC